MLERVIFTGLFLVNIGVFLIALYFGLANEFTSNTIVALCTTFVAAVTVYRAMRRRGYFNDRRT